MIQTSSSAFNSLETAHLVLQGEVAIVKGTEDKDYFIKTPKATLCTVVTLHDEQSRFSALAHIDDYTCAIDTMTTISKTFTGKYNTSIFTHVFKANVLGGNKDESSIKRQETILKILSIFNAAVKKIPLEEIERPQIAFNARNGEITLLKGKQQNPRLEYLQMREYGNFNDLLDCQYGNLSGDLIPYFKIKEAKRSEQNIPLFKLKNNELDVPYAQAQENKREFFLPIQASRTVASDKKSALLDLKKLIDHSFSHAKLIDSFEKGDLNLLLRQAAAEPAYLELFKFLLNHFLLLEIDLASQGKTSGNGLDVAIKYKNEKAIELLKEYGIKESKG